MGCCGLLWVVVGCCGVLWGVVGLGGCWGLWIVVDSGEIAGGDEVMVDGSGMGMGEGRG